MELVDVKQTTVFFTSDASDEELWNFADAKLPWYFVFFNILHQSGRLFQYDGLERSKMTVFKNLCLFGGQRIKLLTVLVLKCGRFSF